MTTNISSRVVLIKLSYVRDQDTLM